MSQPAVAAEAMEDEKTFIDHSRSAGSVVTIRTVSGQTVAG